MIIIYKHIYVDLKTTKRQITNNLKKLNRNNKKLINYITN